MAPLTFHPCRFNFDDQDIRRVGSVTSGGTSLSGIDEPIQTDGGGFWRADFTNGDTLEREDGLAWRAITEAMDGGSTAVNVSFCDRLHQPVTGNVSVPHSDTTPFSDTTLYSSPEVDAKAKFDTLLRATSMTILIASAIPLVGGETFSIEHVTWGWRAYRVIGVDGNFIRFRPPLREAIDAGTLLDFDNPQCQMRLAAATSNPMNIGRYTGCSISFVEDMRKPA